jgi:hypothetical protein
MCINDNKKDSGEEQENEIIIPDTNNDVPIIQNVKSNTTKKMKRLGKK